MPKQKKESRLKIELKKKIKGQCVRFEKKTKIYEMGQQETSA